MAFSGALTLTDLNDFITPAQACIKPVEQTNAPPKQEVKEPGAASTEILIDSSGAYYEVSSTSTPTATTTLSGNSTNTNNKLHQAQISLNDCLACSGCITSAESVLITLQSHTEVLNALAENASIQPPTARKIPVVSIAPQSLASLAASLSSSLASSSSAATPPAQVTPRQVLRRVQVFCREALGFEHVFDTNFGRELALREHIAEFEERRAAAAAAVSANANTSGTSTGSGEQHLPMLASACPGWICYAEKAHAEMLPFIARTKSPQQVMGTLVKTWMASEKWGKKPDGVYHVTVMPCYDKKLEASRKDFYDEVYATRDVDCVITTGELELLMREKGWDLSMPVPGELDPPTYPSKSPTDSDTSSIDLPELVQHPGTSSGSYLHGIIAHLQQTSSTPLRLDVKMIRNADYEEYTLTDGERTVFRGAKCYGFRNLQNIVRKVGRERGVRTGAGAAGRLGTARAGGGGGAARRIAGRRGAANGDGVEEAKYEYVEVMACPGGCVNGGGQLKGKVASRDEESYERDWSESGVKWGDKEWTKRVEEVYWSDQLGESAAVPSGSSSTSCSALVEEVRRQLGSDAFRTDYRAVESEVIGLAVKW